MDISTSYVCLLDLIIFCLTQTCLDYVAVFLFFCAFVCGRLSLSVLFLSARCLYSVCGHLSLSVLFLSARCLYSWCALGLFLAIHCYVCWVLASVYVLGRGFGAETCSQVNTS